MSRKRWCAAGLAVLVTLIGSAGTVIAQDVPKIEFEKYELPNGLDVILYEDHSRPRRGRFPLRLLAHRPGSRLRRHAEATRPAGRPASICCGKR